MRIVTRPDFDGVVCAVLLYEAVPVTLPTCWVQPGDMQQGRVSIQASDIIANLPFVQGCGLWFDHHITNTPTTAFSGAFEVAPSAARVIHNHYRDSFGDRFESLVCQTDDVDAANLSMDQIRFPERYPHVLLSMTIRGQQEDEAPYWNHLVQLLRREPIEAVFDHPDVRPHREAAVRRNAAYTQLLLRHTTVTGTVAVTDFRSLWPSPDGNRFLVYALLPETAVNVKVRYKDPGRNYLIVSIGHSIVNRSCRVNVGKLLSRYGGGGHVGAGACTFPADLAERYLPEIIDVLIKNKETDL